MNILGYLPSSKFVVIVSSIFLSGGLVVAAQHFTHPLAQNLQLTPITTPQITPTGDWMADLRAIEGVSLLGTTTAQDVQDAANTLRQAALSANVTDTVARTLFINLSEAKSQGLGSDVPTQDKLITQAVAQIKKDRNTPLYKLDDLTFSSNTPAALKAYGNAVILAVGAHPEANHTQVLLTVASSTDNGDPTLLKPLYTMEGAYGALVDDLLAVKVPPTIAPLHLQIVNNLDMMTKTFSDMEMIFTDPLRGVAGLDLFHALNNETTRVFINVGQQLNQNGILFSKDEPGQAWGSLISLQQQ